MRGYSPYKLLELILPDGPPSSLSDDGTKYLASVCSCDSCRLDTGMEWSEWAFLPTANISLDAQGTKTFFLPFETLKAYRSSFGVIRYHCSSCSASVFYQKDDRPGLISIAVGLMSAPEEARADTWLEWDTSGIGFREDAVGRAKELNVAVEDGLARYGKRTEQV